MIIIRLAKGGVKKRPFYQIVVSDCRSARDGKFIERVGYFNPIVNNNIKGIYFNMIRVNHWINQGATISKRVYTLLKHTKKSFNN